MEKLLRDSISAHVKMRLEISNKVPTNLRAIFFLPIALPTKKTFERAIGTCLTLYLSSFLQKHTQTDSHG